jgi:secondary thiamine-phosphate synthase enzyme
MVELTVGTPKRECFVDLTNLISQKCRLNNWTDGILTVFVPHTTCGVTINENSDPDVTSDILKHLKAMIPNLSTFAHCEGNSDAHIKTSLVGNSVSLIIENATLQLGTWQAVYLTEFDGPRERKIWLKMAK